MYLEDPIANAASEGVFDDEHGPAVEDSYGYKNFADWRNHPIDPDKLYALIEVSKGHVYVVSTDDIDDFASDDAENEPASESQEYLEGYLDALYDDWSWGEVKFY